MLTRVKLIEDWRWVMRKAWSIRMAVVAAFFSGATTAILIDHALRMTHRQSSISFTLVSMSSPTKEPLQNVS